MRLVRYITALAASARLTLPASAQQQDAATPSSVAICKIDPVHSELSFGVRHLVGQDFGLAFNQLLKGLPVIGDDVDITIAIEAVR